MGTSSQLCGSRWVEDPEGLDEGHECSLPTDHAGRCECECGEPA
jgi:hypothetical protein